MEIHSVSSFLSYWRRIRARTDAVIAAIPAERIEWTYREGKWTLGDLIRHIAALERYMFAENIAGRSSRYPGHGRELAAGHAEVLEYFDRMHEETVAIVSSLSDQRLLEPCTTPGGGRLAVWKWLRAMIEHEVHHRGQIYVYLGHLGVSTPPLYGLTAEEVGERSR